MAPFWSMAWTTETLLEKCNRSKWHFLLSGFELWQRCQIGSKYFLKVVRNVWKIHSDNNSLAIFSAWTWGARISFAKRSAESRSISSSSDSSKSDGCFGTLAKTQRSLHISSSFNFKVTWWKYDNKSRSCRWSKKGVTNLRDDNWRSLDTFFGPSDCTTASLLSPPAEEGRRNKRKRQFQKKEEEKGTKQVDEIKKRLRCNLSFKLNSSVISEYATRKEDWSCQLESPSLSSAWPPKSNETQRNGTQPRLSVAKKQHYNWQATGDSWLGYYTDKYYFCTSMNDWWLTCIRIAILSVNPDINLAGGAVLQENASWHQRTQAAKGAFFEVRSVRSEMFWSTSLESTLLFC